MTWHPNVSDLCGFSEAEVKDLLSQTIAECQVPDDIPSKAVWEVQILEHMRQFYNGSRFLTQTRQGNVEEVDKVYNPTLTFFFLKWFQYFCGYPEEVMDDNLRPDENKLAYLAGHKQGKSLLMDALQATGEVSVSTLHKRFGVGDLFTDDQQRENLAVLLTYLGGLTVSGRTETGNVRLEIPNLVMRQLYAGRALKMMTKESATLRVKGEV
ncbi:MAG: hypothetical protein AAF639_27580 [Chloroflexota bacterium]